MRNAQCAIKDVSVIKIATDDRQWELQYRLRDIKTGDKFDLSPVKGMKMKKM